MTTIPIVLVSGFLGAGKTTLLQNLLFAEKQFKIVVVRNEFNSEINDNDDDKEGAFEPPLLIQEEDSKLYEAFYELPNSCICCTVNSKLVQALGQLIDSHPSVDLVLIECSGVADPLGVGEMLLEGNDERLKFCGICTVVDSLNLSKESSVFLKEELFIKQIASADLLILNKISEISNKEFLYQILNDINTTAKRVETNFSKLGIDLLFQICKEDDISLKDSNSTHLHFGTIRSLEFSFKEKVFFDLEMIEKNLGYLLWDNDLSLLTLYRGKGIFKGNDGSWNSLQIVGEAISITPAVVGRSDKVENKFLFIGEKVETFSSKIEEALKKAIINQSHD